MIHIANGHSLTALIERAGLPGQRLEWCDVLHEGPVPDVAPATLRAIRAAYVSDLLQRPSDQEILADMEQWQRTVDAAVNEDEVVLWYEHDLFDQLNLIQLLHTLDLKRPARVTLVSINSYPGHPGFKGMGELSPSEIASLFPERQPVTDDQYATAHRAWAAFRADDPREIERLLAAGTAGLPYLAAALHRHLGEFPELGIGVSATEKNILGLLDVAPEGTGIDELFSMIHVDETAFYIGDLSFWNVLRGLWTTTPALVDLEIEEHRPGRLPRGTATITEAGSRVLNGADDRVTLCGIDRWLGGVHLEGRGPTWRWEPALDQLLWA